MSALLTVSGVSVHFGGLAAVDDVSFDVGEGDLLGLIGPNGAGKTTIMRAITGTLRPKAGTIELDGKVLGRLAVHERVRLGLGLSQQLVKPFRSMSVIQNVVLAAGHQKTRSPLRAILLSDMRREREKAKDLLATVGIAEQADAMPANLPLGQVKRLEVARALALDPKMLLLDEPLAGLNHIEAAALADFIAGLNRAGRTIILIEHNLGEVLRICNRLVVVDSGRKIADGPPDEVMTDAAVRAAYLGKGSHGAAA